VLLYSVRDPDPTKMNFNDVVKGFCMYNDCVLSEDGLQEGWDVVYRLSVREVLSYIWTNLLAVTETQLKAVK